MTAQAPRYRPLNPRLGTHYAIFMSAFVSLVLLLAILEQLGARKLWLSHIMMIVPVLFYLGIAIMTRTLDTHEYFAAGRRVPAVFGGLAMAVTTIGGIGFFALSGAVYLIGFDALCIALGWGAGFVVAMVLIAPYVRKAGSYTVAGFLRERFGNVLLGPIAALLTLPPAILLLAAELRVGAFVASLFAAVSYEAAIALGAGVIGVAAILGGLRSLTWTQCVQYVVVMIGFLVPVTIVSMMVTNLPLPQLTYGDVFERVATLELAIGVGAGDPIALASALPGEQPETVAKPFLQAFGAISKGDFLILLFCFLAGSATMPSLVMRAGGATSGFEARRAMGWGALFLVLFLVTIPAYAAFAKLLTLQDLVGTPPSQLPDWIGKLREAELADVADRNGDGVIGASEVFVARDGVALSLPIMAGFPFILVVLIATSGIAATLAAGAAHALTMGSTIGEDIYRGVLHTSATPGKRLLVARLATVSLIGLTAWYVAENDFDILRAAAWAMS
ncbi:MAG: sodium:solute symporter family transporter, partial [Geminicoccaceae bacterium]